MANAVSKRQPTSQEATNILPLASMTILSTAASLWRISTFITHNDRHPPLDEYQAQEPATVNRRQGDQTHQALEPALVNRHQGKQIKINHLPNNFHPIQHHLLQRAQNQKQNLPAPPRKRRTAPPRKRRTASLRRSSKIKNVVRLVTINLMQYLINIDWFLRSPLHRTRQHWWRHH